MKDKSEIEIDNVRLDIIGRCHVLFGKDIEFMDSFFSGKNALPEDTTPIQYFAESIKLLANCNLIVFAEGWEDTRGCKLEHKVAKEYNLPIWYID